jgi:hypothetical protein
LFVAAEPQGLGLGYAVDDYAPAETFANFRYQRIFLKSRYPFSLQFG